MLLIQNAYLINPADSREGICDIAIGNGRFLAIEASIPPERAAALAAGLAGDGEVRVIDARGLTAAPGLIDTHSHFRDPGFTRKEDLQTGAAAAARGGYTSVILMANVKPAVDCPDAVRDILERGRKTPVHMYTCANVTLGMQGRELADLKALAEAGAAGFTDDGLPVLNAGLLRAALKIAGPLDLPVSLHEEDPAYIRQPGVNGGGKAAAFHFYFSQGLFPEVVRFLSDRVEVFEAAGGEILLGSLAVNTRNGDINLYLLAIVVQLNQRLAAIVEIFDIFNFFAACEGKEAFLVGIPGIAFPPAGDDGV